MAFLPSLNSAKAGEEVQHTSVASGQRGANLHMFAEFKDGRRAKCHYAAEIYKALYAAGGPARSLPESFRLLTTTLRQSVTDAPKISA